MILPLNHTSFTWPPCWSLSKILARCRKTKLQLALHKNHKSRTADSLKSWTPVITAVWETAVWEKYFVVWSLLWGKLRNRVPRMCLFIRNQEDSAVVGCLTHYTHTETKSRAARVRSPILCGNFQTMTVTCAAGPGLGKESSRGRRTEGAWPLPAFPPLLHASAEIAVVIWEE